MLSWHLTAKKCCFTIIDFSIAKKLSIIIPYIDRYVLWVSKRLAWKSLTLSIPLYKLKDLSIISIIYHAKL